MDLKRFVRNAAKIRRGIRKVGAGKQVIKYFNQDQHFIGISINMRVWRNERDISLMDLHPCVLEASGGLDKILHPLAIKVKDGASISHPHRDPLLGAIRSSENQLGANLQKLP